MDRFNSLITEAQSCRLCEECLPLGPRPVFSIHPKSKVLVIGQAPGTKVHATGIPWNDLSGEELRRWMGFCYPGRGKGGDMPPRPECGPTWHERMRAEMPQVQLTLLIGQYAQKYYLGSMRKNTLTQTVMTYEEYLPDFFPLVHPSPRNRMWQRRNPWFETKVIPMLQERVHGIITG